MREVPPGPIVALSGPAVDAVNTILDPRRAPPSATRNSANGQSPTAQHLGRGTESYQIAWVDRPLCKVASPRSDSEGQASSGTTMSVGAGLSENLLGVGHAQSRDLL